MHIGQFLRKLREDRGLSLRGLARLLKVDPAYLSRIESGKVPPSDNLILAAAEALGADTDALLLMSGTVPPTWQQAIASSPNWAFEKIRETFTHLVAETTVPYGYSLLAVEGTRAIEDPAFPFEYLSDIAEVESWRKEINRPIYHLHKWWAQRLGSVFRAILIGAFAPKGSNIVDMFYQPTRLAGAVVFDPFMGSGTTVGEALKLGARAIGRDINPVSHFAVKNALSIHSRQKIVETFREIEADVAPLIRRYYRAYLPQGGSAEVLYYFWVKVIPCPACKQPVDLFSSYLFAQHAYPARNPEARAVCPRCGAINLVRYDTEEARCSGCRETFNPKTGPANGTKATCQACGHSFPIAKTVREIGGPPEHRLYAKMVLKPDGLKEYLAADKHDVALYEEAAQALKTRVDAFPVVPIEPGYNTNQVLNYCYTHWHQMFNNRQLFGLGLLAERIRQIPDEGLCELFTCLFSGCLEFNNMFASFKGEGTGAVRHMFSHHILKPERTPLEANLWGTPKSSGAFSTLFESRLLRLLDYCDHPFELRVIHKNGRLSGEKVYGLSSPLGFNATGSFAEFQRGKALYLSCGDSAQTDLPAESVDAVVTDPPFFDNVHYSELADFFYVWQRHILGEKGGHAGKSTRSPAEVQVDDTTAFTDRLRGVWAECHRVLRKEGLLIFTYHHSRPDGWQSLLEAVVGAGFAVTAAHPIKAEMSVATPKQQAKEPIDLDVILICRKRGSLCKSMTNTTATLLNDAARAAGDQVARLNRTGRRLSRNDVRVVLSAQIIARLSWQPHPTEALRFLEINDANIEEAIGRLHTMQDVAEREGGNAQVQMALF